MQKTVVSGMEVRPVYSHIVKMDSRKDRHIFVCLFVYICDGLRKKYYIFTQLHLLEVCDALQINYVVLSILDMIQWNVFNFITA